MLLLRMYGLKEITTLTVCIHTHTYVHICASLPSFITRVLLGSSESDRLEVSTVEYTPIYK